MKTHLDIDDDLLDRAMKMARTRDKKHTVHLALQELIRAMKRESLSRLKGKVKWKGNINSMRKA